MRMLRLLYQISAHTGSAKFAVWIGIEDGKLARDIEPEGENSGCLGTGYLRVSPNDYGHAIEASSPTSSSPFASPANPSSGPTVPFRCRSSKPLRCPSITRTPTSPRVESPTYGFIVFAARASGAGPEAATIAATRAHEGTLRHVFALALRCCCAQGGRSRMRLALKTKIF
ncbi:hypothetical protein K438DRAFT_1990499 [Mycena galopus ATCC 62051]|nr:hypothetical protein K438DRAFT_1990499 [Mycena galopus ATCC 62051]